MIWALPGRKPYFQSPFTGNQLMCRPYTDIQRWTTNTILLFRLLLHCYVLHDFFFFSFLRTDYNISFLQKCNASKCFCWFRVHVCVYGDDIAQRHAILYTICNFYYCYYDEYIKCEEFRSTRTIWHFHEQSWGQFGPAISVQVRERGTAEEKRHWEPKNKE